MTKNQYSSLPRPCTEYCAAGIPGVEEVSSDKPPVDQTSSENTPADDHSFGTHFLIIGVGRTGCQIANQLYQIRSDAHCPQFIAIDIDECTLFQTGANKHLHLKMSDHPEEGSKNFDAFILEAKDTICTDLRSAHMIFIVGDAGEAICHAVAPQIAKWASDMHVPIVGAFIMPFEAEEATCTDVANQTLNEMRLNADSVLVLRAKSVGKLMHTCPSINDTTCYSVKLLSEAIRSVIEIVKLPGQICVDFGDVRAVFDEPGTALIGIGLACGPERALLAAQQACASPLLDGIQLTQFKAIFVMISGTRETFKRSESKIAMNFIRGKLTEDNFLIYGTQFNPSLGDRIQLTVIGTGYSDLSEPDHLRFSLL